MTLSPAKIRVTGPDELISLIPWLLGFIPNESVVAVWLENGRIVLTARIDISCSKQPLQHQIHQMSQRLAGAEVVVVCWTNDIIKSQIVANWIEEVLAAEQIIDQIMCDGEIWRSWHCQDPECCPPDGTLLVRKDQMQMSAQNIGLTCASSRGEAVGFVQGPAVEDLPRLRSHQDHARKFNESLSIEEWSSQLVSLVSEIIDHEQLPDEAGLVELAMLASESPELAVTIALLIERHNADKYAELWSAVVMVAPPEIAAGPLSILGIASWVSGHGAIATECCQRLENIRPLHPLLGVLQAATLGALAPAVWDRLRDEFKTS
ncbi:MAG: DUF4192 domain-containing protein [Propionibacteriaceae bacterium]